MSTTQSSVCHLGRWRVRSDLRVGAQDESGGSAVWSAVGVARWTTITSSDGGRVGNAGCPSATTWLGLAGSGEKQTSSSTTAETDVMWRAWQLCSPLLTGIGASVPLATLIKRISLGKEATPTLAYEYPAEVQEPTEYRYCRHKVCVTLGNLPVA